MNQDLFLLTFKKQRSRIVAEISAPKPPVIGASWLICNPTTSKTLYKTERQKYSNVANLFKSLQEVFQSF